MLGIDAIFGLVVLISRHRSATNWRTLGVGLLVQMAFAFLVLTWEPGVKALKWFADLITTTIEFADKGTQFVFGPLMSEKIGFVFALSVLPVIIFLGAIIGLLYYLRVIQVVVDCGAISKVMGTSKVESVWASTVTSWANRRHRWSSRRSCPA